MLCFALLLIRLDRLAPPVEAVILPAVLAPAHFQLRPRQAASTYG